ncbi:hypothetical protein [Maricaulis sp.]|uniref:hypothetical protein n=1 Tax=Maricaulis sp. TaxID=1486257 RepID=UPI0025C111A2|nr:hypothetical protein [Maricaulis sp.]
MTRIPISPAVLGLALATSTALAQPAPHDPAEWHADLDALVETLETNHPNLHHTTSRAIWEAQLDAYRARLPEMSEAGRIVGMARLLALVGDGHTWMPMHALPFDGLPPGPGFRSLPVRLELFDDGLFIVGATDPELVGLRVEAFGRVPVAEALARTLEILPRDAVNFSRELAPEWLMQAELLAALGLAETAEIIALTLTDGDRSRVATLHPLDADMRYDWVFSMDGGPQGVATWHTAAVGTPLWQAPMTAPARLVTALDNAAYLQVFSITDQPEAFAGLARQAVAAAEALDEPVLVLDLRRCLGGDGSLNPAFVDVLIASEALSRPGRIRVLTGRQTHSAAIMLLSRLENRTGAIRFGQAAADRPNHYGETNIWVTPNTGLPLIHASEYYATATPGDARANHAPDITLPYRFDDYAAGTDPVLAAALSYNPET